ncbi:MAG: FAD-binding oxidoreductase [Methylobacteriaceae bacterium]|nr:FAD-binding oxidoreductase [Methylobacteriaceae bacterium]
MIHVKHSTSAREADVAVVGGGVVGSAIALGLAREGARVALLDEGDGAFRASRGNFALIWVQSKGLGMPAYAGWSRKSADAWAGLAALLREESGLDVAHDQPGGFMLCLSQAELEARVDAMKRLHNQPMMQDFRYEVLDHRETKKRMPAIGPDVVGALYSPHDGHVNSLRLFRALREAGARRGVDYRPSQVVTRLEQRGGGFRIEGDWGVLEARRIVLAAGLGNARLAPMVGLEAPVTPSKGQIIVTEKTAPFLRHPVVTVRQTDEGGVMIGDSQEDRGFDTIVAQPVITTMAERAVRMFPALAGLNVVRTWSALRVMTPDGFPIYEQSRACPGAFVATCHSGVTLAANHVFTLAPAILRGELPVDVADFTAGRLHVPAHA